MVRADVLVTEEVKELGKVYGSEKVKASSPERMTLTWR